MATPTGKRTTAPAFQFYPKDFLSSSKVQRMSLTEVGVYTLLLAHCWLDNGLPSDVAQIARLVKIPAPRFRKMWTGPLSECFYLKGGRFHNARLEHERSEQAKWRAKQAANGQKGGRPRNPEKAVGSSGLTQTEPRKSSSSSSPSSSTPPSGGVAPAAPSTVRPMAPIHDRSHRSHAECGRICLHASQFGEFVRRRNHDGADAEVREWASSVIKAWMDGGPHANDEPGDIFDFWRARYAERWPASKAAEAKSPRAPEMVYTKVKALG